MRVLTINLWGTNGPVDERMQRLGDYLAETRPDIVAMQEVERWRDTGQARFLADRAGYAHVHDVRTGRDGRDGRDGEGLAIVTDLDSDPVGTVALPDAPNDHPRAAQIIDVATAAGAIVRVANTHLTWQVDATDARAAQARAIRDELAGWTGSVVLAGDLNDVAGSPALGVLTARAEGHTPLVDTCAATNGSDDVTFDLANPYMDHPELARRRVDHVLVRGLDVAGVSVVLDGRTSPVVSDHYGVLARLIVPGS